MINLKNLLKKPLNPVSNKIVIILAIVALIGFIDASYLTIEHFQGEIPPCSTSSGCENVLSSSYSVVLGLPVSLVGAIYYLVVLVGSLAYLEGKRHNILKYSLLLTIFGFLASLWFVYVQTFIIHAYCLYCLGSYLTSTILFIIAMEIFARHQEY